MLRNRRDLSTKACSYFLYHTEKLSFESLLFTTCKQGISAQVTSLRYQQAYEYIRVVKFPYVTTARYMAVIIKRRGGSSHDLPGSWMPLLLFFDNTVDLWTNAARTIALLSTFTSCSSWHKIQVTNCLCLGTWVCAGPNAVSVTSETIGLQWKVTEYH